jgi:hypothetical protein
VSASTFGPDFHPQGSGMHISEKFRALVTYPWHLNTRSRVTHGVMRRPMRRNGMRRTVRHDRAAAQVCSNWVNADGQVNSRALLASLVPGWRGSFAERSPGGGPFVRNLDASKASLLRSIANKCPAFQLDC